jgi:hypothetical protein
LGGIEDFSDRPKEIDRETKNPSDGDPRGLKVEGGEGKKGV